MQDREGEQGYFRVTPGKQPKSKRPVVLIVFLAIVFIGAVSWLAINLDGFVEAEDVIIERPMADVPPTSSETKNPTASPSFSETPTVTSTPDLLNNPSENHYGFIVLAARQKGNSHLWYYEPGETEPYRLTTGSWDDRHPAISPDGVNLAFSSRRDGNWDLYTLNLETGETRRLTATMGYEGRPSWSPDGQWLAFEAYYDGNFDIWLLPVFGEGEPYKLTSHNSLDLSPVWGPNGRSIIFASNRTGNYDIYLADLEQVEERFVNLTNTVDLWETAPSFDPNSNQLAYVAAYSDMSRIFIQDMSDTSSAPLDVGRGINAIWSPTGDSIAVLQRYPHQSQILSYNLSGGGGLPLSLLLTGVVEGMDWFGIESGEVKITLPQTSDEPINLYDRIIESPGPDDSRYSLIELEDVSAPRALLSDRANEAFEALRRRIALELGWDFLANLDFAFVGINDPLPPGYPYNDWLFTGRAFAISEAIARAGWVELIKEDILGETYWRVHVRTRYQDGSLGEPLNEYPWDFSGRIKGDPTAYDQGGTFKEIIPGGYYVDFSEIAADYGFQRQAALNNWRTYFPGSRYSEFVLTDGLSWEAAMLELYPRAAILTPTPFRTPTPTPTRTPWPTSTPWWFRDLTPTVTSTPTTMPSSTPTQ